MVHYVDNVELSGHKEPERASRLGLGGTRVQKAEDKSCKDAELFTRLLGIQESGHTGPLSQSETHTESHIAASGNLSTKKRVLLCGFLSTVEATLHTCGDCSGPSQVGDFHLDLGCKQERTVQQLQAEMQAALPSAHAQETCVVEGCQHLPDPVRAPERRFWSDVMLSAAKNSNPEDQLLVPLSPGLEHLTQTQATRVLAFPSQARPCWAIRSSNRGPGEPPQQGK